MSRHITIFGPSSGQKYTTISPTRIVEIKLSFLKVYFDLEGVPFSLKPLSLSYEDIKIESVHLSNGEEGFLLDAEKHQFFKIFLVLQEPSITGLHFPEKHFVSVFDMIKHLPLNSSLHVALQSATEFMQVEELPKSYDGYVAFELPPCAGRSTMFGMEQKNDGHSWMEYVTCSSDCFNGTVRLSRCSGYLRCVNIDCPYYSRLHYQNEKHWKGRIKKICSVGLVGPHHGNIVCRHCAQMPECVSLCPAIIYYCIPRDHLNTTRCAIHLGYHNHPYEEGVSRASEHVIEEKVALRAKLNPFCTPKQLESGITQDFILDKLMNDKDKGESFIGEDEFASLLEQVTPLSNKRKIGRCLEYARRNKNITARGLEAVLDLKNHCRYPFIQSVLFPGQLNAPHQPHVFKMSVIGPGSGLDLVNRMRPGGNLQDMWIHFDHVHRVSGWPTMSAHVYDPFLRSLLSIATCEFRVEDRYAQIEFWKMLNSVVQQNGFDKPEFRGFMADEANANWLAVRTVYFGGANKKVPEKERSCTFHWEQSMVAHTRKCIRPSFQEEHKSLCRKWKDAPSEVAAENCKNEIRMFWYAGHAVQDEVPSLETWLAWWDVRISHWGSWFVTQDESGVFVPTTNLAEAKHSSMHAGVGFKSHISLYEATGFDMSMAIMQSVNCNAYLKGVHTGSGPGLQDLAERFKSQNTGRTFNRTLSDLAHSCMNEMGVQSPEMQNLAQGQRSVRAKRPLQVDPAEILENDSHRPEFVTVTKSKSSQKKSGSQREDEHVERKISKTLWAIRRLEPGKKMTCFGKLSGQDARCGASINAGIDSNKNGVPAPCFWGRRKYPGGHVSGFIWFCNSTPTHSWEVDEDHVIGLIGPAPGVWPVDEGTSLQPHEIKYLEDNGFSLEKGVGSNQSVATNTLASSSQILSSFRPKFRDGKLVRWRANLTREFHISIQKGRTLSGQLVREAIVLCNESHIFYVSTEGSQAKGVNYSVTIAEFPRCTCEGFLKRESKRMTYIPCKHLYYVYLQILGLDPASHDFIHQAALTKLELFQALSGRRSNVTV